MLPPLSEVGSADAGGESAHGCDRVKGIVEAGLSFVAPADLFLPLLTSRLAFRNISALSEADFPTIRVSSAAAFLTLSTSFLYSLLWPFGSTMFFASSYMDCV